MDAKRPRPATEVAAQAAAALTRPPPPSVRDDPAAWHRWYWAEQRRLAAHRGPN